MLTFYPYRLQFIISTKAVWVRLKSKKANVSIEMKISWADLEKEL
jgi:hypothetical protein